MLPKSLQTLPFLLSRLHRRLTCLGWLKEMKSGFANAKIKSLTCHHGRQTGLRNSTASAHFILWTFRINSVVPGDYKHEYVDSGVPGRLLVKGKQVASIQSIFPVSFDGKNSYFGGLRNLLQLDKIMDSIPESSYTGDLKSALLRTLLADGGFGHEQPLSFSIEQILDVIDREELLKASKVVDADDLLKKVRDGL